MIKVKIALVHTPLTTPTGGERQVLMLALELQKKGHEVELFTNAIDRERCFPDLIREININVVPYPWSYTPYPFNHILPYYVKYFGMRKIGKELSRRRFDVINNHNFPSEWAVHYARKRSVSRSVWMCNEPPFWFFLEEERRGVRAVDWPLFELLDRRTVKSVDKIMVLSNLTGEIVRKTYGRDYEVIRTGVDSSQFHNADGKRFREKYGLSDALILLQVGQYSVYKRQDDSIRVLGTLAKSHRNLKLVFIGPESSYKERLRALANENGVSGDVLFLGALPDEELRQTYAACDVFLFPSKQSWSLVAAEAMASGKPVIVSDQCGAAEILTNGVNGYSYPHGDHSAMAGCVEPLINDSGLRNRIGSNALAYAKENLTWPKYATQMESAFLRTTR